MKEAHIHAVAKILSRNILVYDDRKRTTARPGVLWLYDKAIYKPGNTVQFRAVVLSPQLKPAVSGGIDVSLRDGAGNLVRDWPRVFTTRGVWAGAVDIADKPVLGNWNISVDVNGQIFTKSFQVAEYVLPKFQVSRLGVALSRDE